MILCRLVQHDNVERVIDFVFWFVNFKLTYICSALASFVILLEPTVWQTGSQEASIDCPQRKSANFISYTSYFTYHVRIIFIIFPDAHGRKYIVGAFILILQRFSDGDKLAYSLT